MRTNNMQTLKIPSDWKIKRNEFNVNEDFVESDWLTNNDIQEDLLQLEKKNYIIDLGWYGSEDLKNKTTGYMLVLFRGENWNNCELLELIRTQSRKLITESINEILKAETEGFYENKSGYRIDENDEENRFIGQHYRYSVMKNLNELLL